MLPKVNRKTARLFQLVDALHIQKTAIARRYGCSRQFVYHVRDGRRPCTRRLRLLIVGMIGEKTAQIDDALGRRSE